MRVAIKEKCPKCDGRGYTEWWDDTNGTDDGGLLLMAMADLDMVWEDYVQCLSYLDNKEN